MRELIGTGAVLCRDNPVVDLRNRIIVEKELVSSSIARVSIPFEKERLNEGRQKMDD